MVTDGSENREGFEAEWKCDLETSTQEFAFDSDELLTVYPNPTSDDVIINYSHPNIRNIRLNIFDNLGRILFQNDFDNSSEFKKELNVANLGDGLKYVQVIHENNDLVFHRKIMVISE